MNSTDIPDDCNDTIEPAGGVVDNAAAEPDIETHVRLGPGSIDALRFKWSVRRESNGYFVDESIGASRSAFSTGPMPRESVMAFIDVRERDATERLEQTRRKLADAMPVAGVFLRPLPVAPVPLAETAPLLSPAEEEPIETLETADTETNDESAVEGSTQTPDTGDNQRRQSVNVDDVMDRIARLLDER